MEVLHGVSVDLLGDRLAHGVADCDRARIVHAAPDTRVIPVGARLRTAGVRVLRQPPITDFDGIEVESGESLLEQAIGREAAECYERALQRLTAGNGALRTLGVEQIRPQSRAVMASARTPHPRSRPTA
jgi:hypothetical protein